MNITHVKPDNWGDTDEEGVIQPSEVADLVHVVELSEEDIELLRGPKGDKGDAGPAAESYSYTPAVNGLPGGGVAVVVAHNLGHTPADVILELTCTAADAGYAVGDVIQSPAVTNGGAIWLPATVWKNSAHVGFYVLAAYPLSVQHKATGGGVALAVAKWSYRFRLRP